MISLNKSVQEKLIDATLSYQFTAEELLYLLRLLRDDRLKEIGNTPISRAPLPDGQYNRDIVPPFGTPNDILNDSEMFKVHHNDIVANRNGLASCAEPNEFQEYPPEKDCPSHVSPAKSNTEPSYPPYLDRAKPEKI